jgi:hypothetical protein
MGGMPVVKKAGGIEPLPRYVMSDAVIPPYDEILHILENNNCSPIGSSYYYILTNEMRTSLCRIVPGGGKIFFHEIIDHEKFGISDEDLNDAITSDAGSFSLNGYYPISSHIDTKLRILLDFS